MTRRPFLIGLTGNIATGKSEVAKMLARLGAQVIDADEVAHEVMRPEGPAYHAVIEAFGPEIVTAEGEIDRVKIGSIVFRNPAALQRLEAAVHPATLARVEQQIAQATKPVVVVEAIKLIESRMHLRCDILWVVTAPRALQIARLMSSRGLSREEAALRVDAQPPQEEKIAFADRVFVNDGDLEQLRQQIEAAWFQIQDELGRTRHAEEGISTNQSQSEQQIEHLPQEDPEGVMPAGDDLEVRRAKRGDIPAISAFIRKRRRKAQVDETEVLEWLFNKGLLVATYHDALVGVAAWQIENLISVTDIVMVSPARLWANVGSRLLAAIETESRSLMCEANIVLLSAGTARTVRTIFLKLGYQPHRLESLHPIWQEVLIPFLASKPELMVKRLQERMIMTPI